MARVTDFLTANIRTIGWIYVIGAVITFLVIFLFFKYIEKAEEEMKNVVRYDDTVYFKKTLQNFIAFTFGAICAVLWVFIPIIIFGLWVYYFVTEKIPELKEKFTSKDEKEETEE